MIRKYLIIFTSAVFVVSIFVVPMAVSAQENLGTYQVNIVADKNGKVSVQAAGESSHIIAAQEQTLFGLAGTTTLSNGTTVSKLGEAIATYFNPGGIVPDQAYLKISEGPWGNMYDQYGWPQTQATVTAIGADVVSVNYSREAAAAQCLDNKDSDIPVQYSSTLSSNLSNTISNSWSNTKAIQVSQAVKYSIGFLGTGAGGTTTLGFTDTWGTVGENSQTYNVGNSNSYSATLPAKTLGKALMTIEKGVMQIRVTYQATLNGSATCHYSDVFRGHYFWQIPINSLLESNKLPITKTFTQDITINYITASDTQVIIPVSEKECHSL